MAQRKVDLFDFLHGQWLVQRIEFLDIFIGQHIIGVPVECFPRLTRNVPERGICDAVLRFNQAGVFGEAAKLNKKLLN